MQEQFMQLARQIGFLLLVRRRHLAAAIAVALLVGSHAAFAKLFEINLEDLVNESTLIALVRPMGKAPNSHLESPRTAVSFEMISVLKGGSFGKGDQIQLCNHPREVESYNLEEIDEEFMVFAKPGEGCFQPILGYRSFVMMEGDVAVTGNIVDQPERQGAEAFLKKVKSLISIRKP
jgi:hypothetical protein